VGYNRRQHFVHRLIYQEINKITLLRNEYVCHKCDNPLCCNLDHLFLGTPSENMQDMLSKGRNINAALTLTQKSEVIRLRESGVSQRQVAKQFGVDKGVIATATKNVCVEKAVRPSKCVILSTESESHTFSSIRKSAKFLGASPSSVLAAISGNRKVYGYNVLVVT
jgi:HNH endonuclease/CENP-B N-terminal DNA-binding domain